MLKEAVAVYDGKLFPSADGDHWHIPLVTKYHIMYLHAVEQLRIRQIDKDIADLSAKNLVITRLHSNGILGVSEYTAQTSEIGNQITALRIERRKKLNEDENDSLLDALKTLNEIITDYQPTPRFDIDLFEQIVEQITVDDNSQLTFHLIGGIKLSEIIKEKGRCKTG